MAILVSWDSFNEDLDKVEIYKSTNPFNLDNLPAEPIATLTGGESSFKDTAVSQDKVYHYMILKYKDGLVENTPLRNYCWSSSRGPGNAELIKGDWRAGWFGEVDNTFMFDSTTFLSLVKDAVIEAGNPWPDTIYLEAWRNRPDVRWHKFAYNGKILIMPMLGVFRDDNWDLADPATPGNYVLNQKSHASWKDLYEAGLMYGIDDFGTVPDGITPTNQQIIIERNNQRYLVRTLRLTDQSGGSKLSGNTTTAFTTIPTGIENILEDAIGGEAGSTLFRLFDYSLQTVENWWKGTADEYVAKWKDMEFREGQSNRFANEKYFFHNYFSRAGSVSGTLHNNTYSNNNDDYRQKAWLYPFAELSNDELAVYAGNPGAYYLSNTMGHSTRDMNEARIVNRFYHGDPAFKSWLLRSGNRYYYPYNWIPVLEVIQ